MGNYRNGPSIKNIPFWSYLHSPHPSGPETRKKEESHHLRPLYNIRVLNKPLSLILFLSPSSLTLDLRLNPHFTSPSIAPSLSRLHSDLSFTLLQFHLIHISTLHFFYFWYLSTVILVIWTMKLL